MLSTEDIQKIQQLLNEIQIKKEQLQQRKQNIEVDLTPVCQQFVLFARLIGLLYL